MTALEFAQLVKQARHGPNGWWSSVCPAHDDQRASLSFRDGDRGLVLECHALCTFEQIAAAVGKQPSDFFHTPRPTPPRPMITARYDYQDASGTLVYQVVRYSPKTFKVRRPDGQGEWFWNLHGVPVLPYRLPALAGAARVYVPEGERDVDTLVAAGLIATTNHGGAGKWRDDHTRALVAAAVGEVIALRDNDHPGVAHQETVARSCTAAGLRVARLILPGLPPLRAKHGEDVTDWLAAGHTVAELETLADLAFAGPARMLSTVHAMFQKWLGQTYDLGMLDAVLAVAASERLNGDPPWLLVISGSGDAKTETVQALEGAGGVVISTIASEGALLSASSQQTRAKDATGGLLRQLGARGLLAIKDVTSILSANSNTRGQVLAALREVYDGKWVRNVGVDGGRTLSWTGRLVLVGAVTTAWDAAHAVIAAMGDRFLLVRADSTQHRRAKSRQARKNIGQETTMRAELAAAVGPLLAGIAPTHALDLPEAIWADLEAVADFVALARTAVETDYRGDPIEAHAPEVPTRLVKQLGQLMRGATALGLSPEAAVRLAHRVARDCIPPARLAILQDVAAHPHAKATEIRHRLDKPRNTVVRLLDALHTLHLVTCEEYEEIPGRPWTTVGAYTLAPTVDRAVLDRLSMSGNISEGKKGEEKVFRKTEENAPPPLPTHIPGHPPAAETEGER